MSVLASTLLDKAEKMCDFDRTSVGIPGLESTNLLSIMNDAVVEYFESFERSGEPNSILQKEDGDTLIADTQINNSSGIVAGATSIIGDDFSEFGASGAIALRGSVRPDYALFGANNLTTTLSTVTGVSLPHDDDSVISLLYALPADYDGMRSEEGYEDGVDVDGTPFFFTTGIPVGNKYAIFDTGSTKYLVFPESMTGDYFVRYNSAPTVITTESSTVDIPLKDVSFAYLRVAEFAAMKLERPDIQAKAERKALSVLNSAHMRRNVGKRPRLRPMRTRSGVPTYLYKD